MKLQNIAAKQISTLTGTRGKLFIGKAGQLLGRSKKPYNL